jgi:hypothetical protein
MTEVGIHPAERVGHVYRVVSPCSTTTARTNRIIPSKLEQPIAGLCLHRSREGSLLLG